MPRLECHGDILKYYVAMDCIAKKAQKTHVCLVLFSRSGRLSDKPFHQVSSTLWASAQFMDTTYYVRSQRKRFKVTVCAYIVFPLQNALAA